LEQTLERFKEFSWKLSQGGYESTEEAEKKEGEQFHHLYIREYKS
jgi:hypothetical protein